MWAEDEGRGRVSFVWSLLHSSSLASHTVLMPLSSTPALSHYRSRLANRRVVLSGMSQPHLPALQALAYYAPKSWGHFPSPHATEDPVRRTTRGKRLTLGLRGGVWGHGMKRWRERALLIGESALTESQPILCPEARTDNITQPVPTLLFFHSQWQLCKYFSPLLVIAAEVVAVLLSPPSC